MFLRNGLVVAISHSVPPCSALLMALKVIMVDQVIELRGDRAEEIGLQAGDTVEIQMLPD